MAMIAATVFTAPHKNATSDASSSETMPISPTYLDFSSSLPIVPSGGLCYATGSHTVRGNRFRFNGNWKISSRKPLRCRCGGRRCLQLCRVVSGLRHTRHDPARQRVDNVRLQLAVDRHLPDHHLVRVLRVRDGVPLDHLEQVAVRVACNDVLVLVV